MVFELLAAGTLGLAALSGELESKPNLTKTMELGRTLYVIFNAEWYHPSGWQHPPSINVVCFSRQAAIDRANWVWTETKRAQTKKLMIIEYQGVPDSIIELADLEPTIAGPRAFVISANMDLQSAIEQYNTGQSIVKVFQENELPLRKDT